ncbi:MAG: ABC transporter permease [Oscillospiraceae bacterium]|nr:ABC transporter permease [Oscillospiraceae bacterium]
MKIKKHIFRKRRVIYLSAAVLLYSVTSAASLSIKDVHSSQLMADRWSADGSPYAQISVFYPPDEKMYTKTEACNLRESIQATLDEEAYKPLNENAQVWTDAYSSQISVVQISSSKNPVTYMPPDNGMDGFSDSEKPAAAQSSDTANASIIGVDGDFFEFHPLELISGNYIYQDQLSTNTVVLDEKAAWSIYSSSDVTGLPVYISGTEFIINGVVKSENNAATKDVYPEAPLVYIHYGSLEAAGASETLGTYEAVLPDPVDNYAKNIVLKYYGIDSMTEKNIDKKEQALACVIRDNTNRYSTMNLWKNVRTFDRTAVVSKPVALPYWENAALITSARLTALFFIRLLCAAASLLIILAFLLRVNRERTWHLKDFTEKLMYKYTYKKRVSDYIRSYEEDNIKLQKKGN